MRRPLPGARAEVFCSAMATGSSQQALGQSAKLLDEARRRGVLRHVSPGATKCQHFVDCPKTLPQYKECSRGQWAERFRPRFGSGSGRCGPSVARVGPDMDRPARCRRAFCTLDAGRGRSANDREKGTHAMAHSISRRSFIAGAASVAPAAAAGSASVALAGGTGTAEDMKFAAETEQGGVNSAGSRYTKQAPVVLHRPVDRGRLRCHRGGRRHRDRRRQRRLRRCCSASTTASRSSCSRSWAPSRDAAAASACATPSSPRPMANKIGQDLTVNVDEAQHR